MTNKPLKVFDAEVSGEKLELGDVVQVFDGAYGDATVKKILDKDLILFRPYVSTADFHYEGGVICYIGIEEFSVPKSGWYRLVQKAPAKENAWARNLTSNFAGHDSQSCRE